MKISPLLPVMKSSTFFTIQKGTSHLFSVRLRITGGMNLQFEREIWSIKFLRGKNQGRTTKGWTLVLAGRSVVWPPATNLAFLGHVDQNLPLRFNKGYFERQTRVANE
jgi:hypothetical protein